jgi:hypothetical protein
MLLITATNFRHQKELILNKFTITFLLQVPNGKTKQLKS